MSKASLVLRHKSKQFFSYMRIVAVNKSGLLENMSLAKFALLALAQSWALSFLSPQAGLKTFFTFEMKRKITFFHYLT